MYTYKCIYIIYTTYVYIYICLHVKFTHSVNGCLRLVYNSDQFICYSTHVIP